MAHTDKTEEIELTLKKAMGNVLPTSGGQDNSLISSEPFKYSQFGLATSDFLADALSKIQLDIKDALSKFKFEKAPAFWESVNEEIKNQMKDQQNKLLEHTKVSITDELRKVAESIAKESSLLGQQGIRNQIEDQQRKVLEQTRVSITDELKKLAQTMDKERPLRLSPEKFQTRWDTLRDEAIRNQIENQQKEVLENVSKSISKSLREATRKNNFIKQ